MHKVALGLQVTSFEEALLRRGNTAYKTMSDVAV
jgi:hypothetical protein